jgi:integrase
VSVHKYKTGDGTRYEVRWREGKRARSRAFASKKDANAFDVNVRARKLRGEPIPHSGRETLAQTYEQWKQLRAPHLARSTLTTYEAVWDAHVKDSQDQHTLAEFIDEPHLIESFVAEMRENGVGNATQRKVLVVMSAVFTSAVEWNKISINPVRVARKPPATQERIPRPFPPLVVERIRLQMRRRATKDPSKVRALGDGCLITLMAYAGLRPGEALALTWGDVGTRTLAIDKAVSVGEVGPTKMRNIRSAPLAAPLAADLAELRKARQDPGEDQLVIAGPDDAPWSRSAYNNWRNRVWKPVMAQLASSKKHPVPRLASAIPRDCRSTFVSLHLRSGASPLEVARWAGHSPKVMFDHYAAVIDELVGEPSEPVEDQIIRARDTVAKLREQDLDKLIAEVFKTDRLLQLAPGTGDD